MGQEYIVIYLVHNNEISITNSTQLMATKINSYRKITNNGIDCRRDEIHRGSRHVMALNQSKPDNLPVV